MLKNVKLRHIQILFWLSALATIAAVSPEKSNPELAITGETDLEKQIHEDIQSTIDANKNAQSYREWVNSEKSPKSLFENLRGLTDFNNPDITDVKARKKNILKIACKYFEKLDPEDLTLFQKQIAHENLAEMPCAPELMTEIHAHWETHRLAMRLNSGNFLLGDNVDGDQLKKLPSIEFPVDTGGGPIFDGSELKKGQIAITIDDGPDAEFNPRILKTLDDYGVRANFFEIGENADAHPEVSRETARRGHIVGSHSMTHPDLEKMAKMSEKKAQAEIDGGVKSVSSALAPDFEEAPFFRFPYGAPWYDEDTKTLQPIQNYAQEKTVENRQSLGVFYWNMDSLDWQIRNPVKLFKRIQSQIDQEKGGIILIHEIHEQTTIVLPFMLQYLSQKGFTTVVFVPEKSVKP